MNVRVSVCKFVLEGLMLCLLFPLVSCGKEGCDGTGLPRREVCFGTKAPDTRSGVQYEGKAKSLDVLVFRRSDGLLDAHGRVVADAQTEEVSSVSVSVSSGLVLDWFVVANALPGAFDGILTRGQFLAAGVRLEQSVEGTLVMFSSGSLGKNSTQDAVSVELERYACKVSLEKVTVGWDDAFVSPDAVALGRVALVNVVGSVLWDGSADPGAVWYNRMGIDAGLDGSVSAMTVAVMDAALEKGVASSVDCSLYCMPNGVHNNDNALSRPEWTPRTTRLAVEVVVGGESNWYPVDLPVMSRNTHYVIRSLTINGPGAVGPDYPLMRDDMQFSFEVLPWYDNHVIPEYGD